MTILMWAHIAGGSLALLSGSIAVAARKGGRLHARAGTWFVVAMLSLWLTATSLHIVEGRPASAVGDLFIGYFVATAWAAARQRDGRARRIQIAACGLILAVAAAIGWGAFTRSAPPTPVGWWPLFVMSAVCLLAGLLDLRVLLGAQLAHAQRIARHMWRMCAAFFIATGSFFIGQQEVLPAVVRGSPALLALGFAPLAVMLFWLVRLRLAVGRPGAGRLSPAAPPAP